MHTWINQSGIAVTGEAGRGFAPPPSSSHFFAFFTLLFCSKSSKTVLFCLSFLEKCHRHTFGIGLSDSGNWYDFVSNLTFHLPVKQYPYVHPLEKTGNVNHVKQLITVCDLLYNGYTFFIWEIYWKTLGHWHQILLVNRDLQTLQ